ncbi:MAG: fimbrillin family protein [Alistipes sp.]|nr:fimbrillin family protein [Alistipes sp.]
MRKLLIAILATGAMVSCSMDETVETKSPAAISFADSFVEGVTRANDPSTTTANITEFSVWSYMNAVDGYVFNDETVTKSGDKWTYANLQYWMPGNKYAFAAFAGDRSNDQVVGLPEAMAEESLSEITFKNVEGTNDILFAEAVVENAAENQAPVKFQFDHLLSKVKFTFKNGFANQNNYLVVKNIKMVVPYTGTVLLDQDQEYDWADQAGETTLDFGHMAEAAKVAIGKGASSDNERLTIPAAADEVKEYTVTFDVELYNGEQCGLERAMEVKISELELKPGRAYNFVATINQENLDLNVIEFTCEVDEWEEQEIDGGAVEEEVTFVTSIDELQDILDAATGNTSVVLGADLTGEVTVPEVANSVIAINGNGHKFDGCFFINGKSTYAGATTIFENINFETADASALVGDAFIYCGEEKGTGFRYPDNVTIKNCSFTATGAAVDATVGAKFWSLNGNLVVEGCEAEGLHSLMQLTSCGKTNLTVNETTIANCKNGISLEKTGKTVISKSEISTREYGVRANGCVANTSIVNTKITAKQPVIVRKVTVAGYVLNVDEDSVLTPSGDYQVIFTKGSDDAAYEAPAVDFTCNVPTTTTVFPKPASWVTTPEEFAAALKSDKENIAVTLTQDIEVAISTLGQQTGGSGEYKLGGENTKNITIDLNGKKLTISTTYWSNLGAKNDNAIFTIKNGTMTSSQPTGTWNSYDLCFSNCNYVFENVTFEKAIALGSANKNFTLKNVTINETHDYYAMWIEAVGQNVNIDGLTVNSAGRGIKIDEQYVDSPAKVNLTINDAVFTTAKKAAILVKSVAGAKINVNTIDITAVAADSANAVWVDADAAAYADKVVVTGASCKVEE